MARGRARDPFFHALDEYAHSSQQLHTGIELLKTFPPFLARPSKRPSYLFREGMSYAG